MLSFQTHQLIYSHVDVSTSIKDWLGKVKLGAYLYFIGKSLHSWKRVFEEVSKVLSRIILRTTFCNLWIIVQCDLTSKHDIAMIFLWLNECHIICDLCFCCQVIIDPVEKCKYHGSQYLLTYLIVFLQATYLSILTPNKFSLSTFCNLLCF